MSPKPPSKAASLPTAKATSDQASALADLLADKPYGDPGRAVVSDAVKPKPKAKVISISLPPALVESLEDHAHKNKKAGTGQKTVSGLIREALEAAGFRS